MRTINRPPASVGIPDVDYKYFNHYNWKGLNTNENYYDLDPETFESAENIYVDEKGILKSRPSLHPLDKNLTNIIKSWSFGHVQVYLTDADNEYTLHFIDAVSTVIEAVSTLDVLLVYNNDKIFIFNDDEFKYYDLLTKSCANADEFKYIPITKTITNGVEDEYESVNLFSDIVRHRYLIYGDYSYSDFTKLINKNVTIITDGYENSIKEFKVQHLKTITTSKFTFDNKLYEPPENFDFSDDADAPYIENRKFVSMSEQETAIFCEYLSDGSFEIYYWHNNTLEYLDKINDCVVEPKITKNGNYVYALKKDGIYFKTLVSGASNNYANFTRLYTVTLYNMSNAEFYDSSTGVYVTIDDSMTSSRKMLITSIYDDYSNTVTIGNLALNYRFDDENLGTGIALVRPKIYSRLCANCLTYNILFYRLRKHNIGPDSCKAVTYCNVYQNDTSIEEYELIGDMLDKNGYAVAINQEIINNTNFIVKYFVRNNSVRKSLFTFSNNNFIHNSSTDNAVSTSLFHYPEDFYTYNDSIYADGAYVYSLPKYVANEPISKLYIKPTVYQILSENENGLSFLSVKNDICSLQTPFTKKDKVKIDILFYVGMQFSINYLTLADVYYAMQNNKLIIGKNAYDKDGNFLWYFPKDNIKSFSDKISTIKAISNSQVAIFLPNEIWYTEITENGITVNKSKIALGCNIGDEVIASFDGKYTIFPSKRGLVALSYQDFVASTDQTITYLSDAILPEFVEFRNNAAVKMFLYKYWLFCYHNTDGQIYILDFRNNSWWYWQLPSAVLDVAEINDEPELIINGKCYGFDHGSENYFDYILENKMPINWHLTSQKLNLGTLNNYKHIINLTLNAIQESDDPMYLTLSLANYRDTATKIDGKVLEYQVDVLKTFVKRLNYYKVNHFQYKLENTNNIALQIPLSIDNVSIKYKVTGQVR